MKHGVAFRKFSRTSSHRMLMLRNLVTSLFEHEQISTTLPKARDTARLAEKIITLGKKGDRAAHTRASAFLLQPSLVPKLFGTFAKRYADRPGGYTRIHKFGNRPGDNAPRAILELVDNPRDLRWEMTSRAIGWEMLQEKLKSQKPLSIINKGVEGAQEVVDAERRLKFGQSGGLLRPKTRWNLQKLLKFRDSSAPLKLGKKVGDYVDHLLATPVAFRSIHEEMKERNPQNRAPRPKAGQALPGETRPTLSLARGALARRETTSTSPVLSMKTVFGRKYKNA
ncbi:50S ribosomal protein L17 [Hypsizygus marmoreus]|uniref:50S ribosomal protein L17 n=1 Tax=Hypsizygus marmoreus TaxID=39966 RepID=A0A369KE31_HYPMA|nr:50S ribosomal protein L17 [Hypsizygus marmoreus]